VVLVAMAPFIGRVITSNYINEISAAYQGTNRYAAQQRNSPDNLAALPGASDF
jgi:hypothetical protein